jgi:hypothetical protein
MVGAEDEAVGIDEEEAGHSNHRTRSDPK